MGIRREFIGINGEEVRNLRGIRGDFLGICTELKGNWWEEVLGNSCEVVRTREALLGN